MDAHRPAKKRRTNYAWDVQGAVVDDCGHFVPEEYPDEFVRAVAGFWASRC